MQTVNEVRLAILQNFLDDVNAALQDESDPEDLRWRIGEIEGTYRSALEAAMPKAGDAVTLERFFVVEGDTPEEIEGAMTMLGTRQAVCKVFTDGVVTHNGHYFSLYDEVAFEGRG